MTPEQRVIEIAHARRAAVRARAVLKPGDKLLVTRCCNARGVTVRFVGWDGDWILTPTLSDVSSRCILKVNGKPVSFCDPTGFGAKE